MIHNNKFFFKKLKAIVFIGQSDIFDQLIKINNNLSLKTIIITSEDQSKIIDKKKVKFSIFNKIDKKFQNFIVKETTLENTLFISIGARIIFTKKNIENFFKDNLINFHLTRLPLDSGGADISWRIMREDRIDNQLCHLVDENIDTGPIIYNKPTLIPKNYSTPKEFLDYKLSRFLEFYADFIKKLTKKEKFELRPQINYLGRYNPRLNAEIDGLIDWNMNSYDLINFINAFEEPYKGASSYLNNGSYGKLYLKDVQLHGGDSSNHPFMSGIVSRHDGGWIVVSTTGKHMLLIEKVLNKKGKNIIDKIKVGDRFYTPSKELGILKEKKRNYNSKGFIK
ncbi:MAG: hypothetical protein CMI90_01615 [Pelagibacteraceae bacterium]|nr:hypothetical protein [Pelagibacteraceae bacterium]